MRFEFKKSLWCDIQMKKAQKHPFVTLITKYCIVIIDLCDLPFDKFDGNQASLALPWPMQIVFFHQWVRWRLFCVAFCSKFSLLSKYSSIWSSIFAVFGSLVFNINLNLSFNLSSTLSSLAVSVCLGTL